MVLVGIVVLWFKVFGVGGNVVNLGFKDGGISRSIEGSGGDRRGGGFCRSDRFVIIVRSCIRRGQLGSVVTVSCYFKGRITSDAVVEFDAPTSTLLTPFTGGVVKFDLLEDEDDEVGAGDDAGPGDG